MQATALRATTASTASYISTPGPFYTTSVMSTVKRFMNYYQSNILEINYNQQLTNGMNPDYLRELPAHCLKH